MSTVAAALQRASMSPALRARLRWLLGWAAVWTSVVVLAFMTATTIPVFRELVLAPTALIVVALVARRAPLLFVFGMLGLASFGFSIRAFLGFGYATVFELLCWGVVLGAIGALIGPELKRVRMTAGTGLLLAFIVISGVMILGAPSFQIAEEQFRKTHLFLAVLLAVAYVPLSQRSVRRAVLGLVVLGCVVGAYGTARYFVGPSGSESVLARTVTAGYFEVGGAETLIGTVGAGHTFSAWLTPMIPFLAVIALWLRGPWRLLALAGSALCLFCMLGTETRSGLAAAIAGVVVTAGVLAAAGAAGRLRLPAVFLTAVACIAGAIVVVSTFETPEEREGRPVSRYQAILEPGSDKAFQERLYRWNNAKDDILEKPLGHGVGLTGEAGKRRVRFVDNTGTLGVDNSWLKVAYEQGPAVALLLLASFLCMCATLAMLAIRTAERRTAVLALASLATLIAFGIELNFESTYIELSSVTVAAVLIGLGLRGATRPLDPVPTTR